MKNNSFFKKLSKYKNAGDAERKNNETNKPSFIFSVHAATPHSLGYIVKFGSINVILFFSF